MTGIKVKPT